MSKYLLSITVVIQLTQTPALVGQAAHAAPRSALPADAITSIIDAFRTHDIATLSDPHGNVQVQALLLSLIRDPRFPDAANDITIETASARYQDAIDRFVRGDDVPMTALRCMGAR